MAKSFISNKQYMYVICVIIVIYLLYLGYKYFTSYKEGLDVGNAEWVHGQHNTPGWENKVCINRKTGGGSSVQKAKLININGDWAASVQHCLNTPNECGGGGAGHGMPSTTQAGSDARAGANAESVVTYNTPAWNAVIDEGKLLLAEQAAAMMPGVAAPDRTLTSGKFFRDDWGATGVINRSIDPTCVPPEEAAAAAAAAVASGGGEGEGAGGSTGITRTARFEAWDKKACLDDYGHSSQTSKVVDINGDWATAVEHCLQYPLDCDNGQGTVIPGGAKPPLVTYQTEKWDNILNSSVTPGMFYKDSWGAKAVIQREGDPDCIPGGGGSSSPGSGGAAGGGPGSSDNNYTPVGPGAFSLDWSSDGHKQKICSGLGTSQEDIVVKDIKEWGTNGFDSIGNMGEDPGYSKIKRAVDYCVASGNYNGACTGISNLDKTITGSDTIEVLGKIDSGLEGWHYENPYVRITRTDDATCYPKWDKWDAVCAPSYTSTEGDGVIGVQGYNAKLNGDSMYFKNADGVETEESRAAALNACLSSDKCGVIPNHDNIVVPSINESRGESIAGSNPTTRIQPFGRGMDRGAYGWVFKQGVDECSPKWGKWSTECLGSTGKSQTWAKLHNVIPSACPPGKSGQDGKCGWWQGTAACLTNGNCPGEEPMPAGNPDVQCSSASNNITLAKQEATCPLAEDKPNDGAYGTIYNNNDPKCYAKWQPWQPKKCTGFKSSEQWSQLRLPPGIPNSDKEGETAVEFCLKKENRDKCTDGNPALDVPWDPNIPDSEQIGLYSEEGSNERWGALKLTNDPYCYPTWQPWQGKQCIGYKKSKDAARLTVHSWEKDTGGKITAEEAALFCLQPENESKCSGPSPSESTYNASLDPPPHGSQDTLLGSSQGWGEVWGEIQIKNDESCEPIWQDGREVEKTKARYGMAKYEPKMEYKPGFSFGGTTADCRELLRDLSFTSSDDFTWETNGDLCKGNNCYSSTFVKNCTSPPSFDGRKYGKFIKRDAEYAGIPSIDEILPWNLPGTLKGINDYYIRGPANRIPSFAEIDPGAPSSSAENSDTETSNPVIVDYEDSNYWENQFK